MASPKIKQVKLGKVVFGNPHHFVLIGGPCVIENESMVLHHAERISKIAKKFKIPYVFKSSYDKANRSSIKSFRGPGLKKGLAILSKVKKELGLPVLSDVHCKEEIKPAQEVLDIIQIPAFLCRQTDLIVAAGKSGKIVNVKKGQFLSPWEVQNIIHKIEATGNKNILVTERGFSFGYQNLVNDFRAIPIIRSFGYPLIFDATHSVQLPGGGGIATAGVPEFIPTLARCAIAAGADALFLEIHENPKEALSDGTNMLAFNYLEKLLGTLVEIRRVAPLNGEI
ncbi:MAG: 3-deoxy-8-phosphooctulonate synthase [Candidatus Omnitrophica bacterium]|nr:3-deoxy-8-phosphooctulonate synthase [Candidatus Omnitrophota bacterium]